ncbi:hypothetical protein GGR95_001493 [Sulfitobacter undariae]|uniref:Uncharacterized protein n=1 Tax=Sulfitobacter undariae TaxID=1563671 RepID=A0A7W6E321_9RHOB|nr:hypothetical protein [Sulfitobacter undariae]MBB3993862.1 hypothetical protein [Sulfitobacter undariae]
MKRRVLTCATLFWCCFVVALIWCTNAFVNSGINEFYHPMAARGDLFHPVRKVALPLIGFAAVAMLGLWFWRRPLAPQTYLFGLAAIVGISMLPILPKIDSGYQQVYRLGDVVSEVPWRYGPVMGGRVESEKYFTVTVTVPDLAPVYGNSGPTLTIGKAIDFNNGEGGAVPAETCNSQYGSLDCQWQHGDFVYFANNSREVTDNDLTRLMPAIVELLDSFQISLP